MKRVSKKRQADNAHYTKKRRAFLALNTFCFVCYELGGETVPSTEVHHIQGRIGDNYLNELTWLPVSRKGHAWIHDNPQEARRFGWLRTPTGAELMKARAAR